MTGAARRTPPIPVSDDAFEITYVRAPGPGGQHVNKTATCAQLRFDAARCAALDDAVRARLLALAGQRATTEGMIVLRAHRHRSRERNRLDAIQRMRHLIAKAARPPKKRTKTRPTRASRERRMEAKKQHAAKKRQRGRVGSGE